MQKNSTRCFFKVDIRERDNYYVSYKRKGGILFYINKIRILVTVSEYL